jgi:hypothetical protein
MWCAHQSVAACGNCWQLCLVGCDVGCLTLWLFVVGVMRLLKLQ